MKGEQTYFAQRRCAAYVIRVRIRGLVLRYKNVLHISHILYVFVCTFIFFVYMSGHMCGKGRRFFARCHFRARIFRVSFDLNFCNARLRINVDVSVYMCVIRV